MCHTVNSSNQPNHREAAQNVQCIHTSRDKGTRFYNCHQDWRLGNCGLTQVASNSPPLGSHGLCPYMYVNAFEHEFYAIIKPDDCVSKRMATFWPAKFKMGYMEKRKWYALHSVHILNLNISYYFTTQTETDVFVLIPTLFFIHSLKMKFKQVFGG